MDIVQQVKTKKQEEPTSVFIYHSQNDGQNQGYRSHELDLVYKNVDEISIRIPFHLSKSNQTRFLQGFTNQPNEKIEYSPIESVGELSPIFQKDCSGTLFKDNYRRKGNFIQSDVLCFDIDNDDPNPKYQPFWDDKSNWITVEGFTDLFKDYDFVISTSKNHLKSKKGRDPRPKFHVFLPVGQVITDSSEHEKMLDMVDFYTQKDGYTRIDTSVGSVSQIFGFEETKIYYHRGGSINDLLLEENFRNDYNRYKESLKKSRTYGFGKNTENNRGIESDKESFCLEDWDFVNIVSKYPVEQFYPTIVRRINNGNGNGYFIGHCELHQDDSPSLQIFDNGGFNCFGCGKKHGSSLVYESLKTGRQLRNVREKYCRELGLDPQDFIRFLSKKDSPIPNGNPVRVDSKTSEVVSIESSTSDESDPAPYPHVLTMTEDYFVDNNTYKILQGLNFTHSMISQEGKVSTMFWEQTRHSNHKELKFQSVKDFKDIRKDQRYTVKTVSVSTGKESLKPMYLGDIWEMWKDRRSYHGLDFHPYDERNDYEGQQIWDEWDDWETSTEENGWKGDIKKRGLPKFMDLNKLEIITPDSDLIDLYNGCDKYLHHLEHVICGNYTGNTHTQLMDYLLGWMSKCVTTHGSERVKVGLVLQGRQGTGKGTMVSLFGEIFGKHFLHILNSERLVGNFNIHLMDKLLVYINESIFGGDRKVMNILKGLLTEDEIQLEGKYMNSFTGRSHMKFIFSSNEDWVVPVQHDDRRYMVIDISDQYSGVDSRDYFRPIYDQWKNGGREYFYRFLTHPVMVERSNEINYESDRPMTTGRTQQMLMTDPTVGYIHEVLLNGGHRVFDTSDPTDRGWKRVMWNENEINDFYLVEQIYEDYKKFCRDQNITKFVGTKEQLSKHFGMLNRSKKLIFESKRCRSDRDKKNNPLGRTTVWRFGSLNELKDLWVKNVWGGDVISCWGSPMTEDDDIGSTPTLWSK